MTGVQTCALPISTATIGPAGGRVLSVAVDPSDSTGNTVYIGTTGGVFKSTNAAASSGVAFVPVSDLVPAVDVAHTHINLVNVGAVSVQPGRVEKRRELPIRDEAMNYFLGVPGKEQPELELTYNFGVDSYELGTGYGHIALTIDSMDETLAALAEKGIEPERPPYSVREGGSLLCFVRDPDGYRIELIERSDY